MFSKQRKPVRQDSSEIVYRRSYSTSESPESKQPLKSIPAPLNESEEESDDDFVRDERIQIENDRAALEEKAKGKGKGRQRKKSATPVKVKREESPVKPKRKYVSDSSGEDNSGRTLIAPKLYGRSPTTGKLDIPHSHAITPSGLKWEPPSDDTDSDLSGPHRKGKKRYVDDYGTSIAIHGKKLTVKVRPDLDEEDAVKYLHVKGGWRSKWNKAHPEFVPVNRMEMEKKWNPLINLLGIELRVENEHGENGMDDSDAESSEDDRKRFNFSASEAEESDGKGGIVNARDTKPSSKMQIETDSDEDDSPRVKMEVDVKPKIPSIKSDPLSEPDTEDEFSFPARPVVAMELEEPDTEDESTLYLPVVKSKPVVVKREPSPVLTEPDTEDDIPPPVVRSVKGKEREHSPTPPTSVTRSLRHSASSHSIIIETDDDESEEEERRVAIFKPKTYPRVVRKGRPKFKMLNADQEAISHFPLNNEGARVNAHINRFLRPYQQEGIKFLYGQYRKGKGGILGDDMGLGKTVQVIGFLSAVMEKAGIPLHDKHKRAQWESKHGPIIRPSTPGVTCLIACPPSVIDNWDRELRTWGYFDVGIYRGRDRKDVIQRFNMGLLDIVLVGLEAARGDIGILSTLDFTIVIVDEAHKLKNPRSATTKAFHQFPTRFRYGLTGTAVQNDLGELWTLLDWANPGEVGTAAQWDLFISLPLKHRQKKDAEQEVVRIGTERAVALHSKLLPQYFLRRTKDIIADQLPRKRDNIVLCPLTHLQLGVYQRLLAQPEVQIMLTSQDPCRCGRRDSSGTPFMLGKCCESDWYKPILKYINLFQKVANHLALIYPDKKDLIANPDKFHQDLAWAKAAFPTDYATRKANSITFTDGTLCGKWRILQELLAIWHKNGDKVLIFSMSIKILELLKGLMQVDLPYEWRSLSGSTPSEERLSIVDEFNNDPKVFAFLISTKAGGVGLNLTSANKVVIFDPNWNPSHDLQAMDRAYRFGQTRDVDVYRLVGAGTLEELIYNRQQYKRAQSGLALEGTAESRPYAGVEGDKNHQGELYGVKNIFKLQDSSSMTKKVIMDCEEAEKDWALEHLGKELVDKLSLDSETKSAMDSLFSSGAGAGDEVDHEVTSALAGATVVRSDASLGGSRIAKAQHLANVQKLKSKALKSKSTSSSKPASTGWSAFGPR